MAIRGGGNFRAIIAETMHEVVVVRRLMPSDPEPSAVELAALAEAYRLGSGGYDPRSRELELANGGLPVRVRVVAHATAGPLAYALTASQTQAFAGLP